MRNRDRLSLAVLAVAITIVLTACGGGGGSQPISVSLSQTSPQTLQGGQTLTISATVSNDSSNQGVTWTISPASGCGTLSSTSGTSITYTAPESSSLTAACSTTITATSVTDSSKSASVQITVNPVSVTISGAAQRSAVAGGATLSLTGSVTNDPANAGISWSLSPTTTCGSLTANGTSATYTPPAPAANAACTATVTATSASDSSKKATVTITVTLPPITLSLSPNTSQTLNAGATLPLTATIGNDFGNQGVTWSVSPTTGCGSVAADGTSATYTAPTVLNSSCTATISVTAVSDNTKTASVSATVNPISVVVSPNSAQTLAPGQTLPLTGTLTNDGTNSGLTWTITPASACGTLSATTGTSITYTAPAPLAAQCEATITVASTADGSKAASVAVTVNPIAVTLSPAGPLTLGEAATQTVHATVSNDLSSSGVTWALSPATGCGTLSGSTSTAVTYNAPTPITSACIATVTATSVTDNAKTASVDVTVNPITIGLSPSTAQNIFAGDTLPLSATLTNDGANHGVSWTLSPATGCGSLNSNSGTSNTYTAPTVLASECNVTVTVASVTDSAKTAQVSITVSPAIVVTLSPNTSQTLWAGETLQITPTVSNDSASQGANLTLAPATGCGSLSSSTAASGTPVTYTAPTSLSNQCTVTVTAKSVSDNNKQATLSITVNPTISVTLSPSSPQFVNAGKTLQITPTVAHDVSNQGVNLTLSPATGCGTLSAGSATSGTPVTYTAPVTMTNSCSVTVTATSVADNTKSATLDITANPAIVVSLMPNTQQNLDAGGSLQITPTITNDGTNGGVNFTLNPATGCGSVSPMTNVSSGTPVTFTAPSSLSNTCSVTVRATSITDNTKSDSVDITVYPGLTLPPPNPTSLGSATVGGNYQGAINAAGGYGEYTWTVNGTTVNTNGTPLAIANGLSASNTGGNTLMISGTPTSATTVNFTVSVKDGTGTSVGPYNYSITATTPDPLTLPAPNPSSLGSANVGTNYLGAINASGGVPGYTFTVNGSTVNTNGTPLTISNGLSATNTGGNSLTISGTPTSATTVNLNVSVKDSVNTTVGPVTYTIDVTNTPPLIFNADNLQVPQGMATMPYGMSLQNNEAITGGTYPYTYSFTGLPSWASYDQNGYIMGTPTAAGSFTVNFTVKDSSSAQQTVTGSFTIPVVPLTTGTNNSKMNGHYACLSHQLYDSPVTVNGNNFYMGATLLALTLNGSGSITGGEADSNTPRSGYTSAAQNGSFSGTYAVGSDNRGYLKVVNSGETTFLALVAGAQDSNGQYSEVRLTRMDDVGTSPSEKHGGGVCYKQYNTGSMNGQTLSGGYVFAQNGEGDAGQQTSGVGSINISNGTATGIVDMVSGSDVSLQNTFSGMTVSSADSFGRVVLSCASDCGNTVVYITNQSDGKALMMSADPHNTNNELSFGELRAQNAGHIAAAEPFNGPFVMYLSGEAPSNSESFKAMVAHGAGSSSAKTITFDAMFQNHDGTLKFNEVVNQAMSYTVNTSTGRVAFSFSPADVAYLYDTNSAVVLFADSGNGGGDPQNMLGWIEPQTNPTANGGKWVFSNLAGNFFMTSMFNGGVYSDSENDAINLDSSGNIVSMAGDRGGAHWASWDNGLSMGGSGTATGALSPDLTLDPDQTIGVFDVKLTQDGTTYTVSYCFAASVNTATNPNAKGRVVCVDAMDKSPKISFIQQ